MLRQGLVPDNFIFPLVVKACSGSNYLEQGRIVRDQIVLNDTWGCATVGSGLRRLFKRMTFEGLRPDSVILATVLPACGD